MESNTCFYCGTYYPESKDARKCENNHDIVYVPILRDDLNRLINYIATGNRELLTERLARTLFRYTRSS